MAERLNSHKHRQQNRLSFVLCYTHFQEEDKEMNID